MPDEPMRSYYITPRRLTTNTFLWKTINMMKIINKDRLVELPPATSIWLGSNWASITPENAVLCIEYSDRTLNYPWDNNPIAAQKILDIMMTRKDMWDQALMNKHLKESVLLSFIEGPLQDMIKNDALNEVKRKSYRLAGDAQSFVSTILRSDRIQTYQIELIYNYYAKSYPNLDTVAYLLAESTQIGLIPDYIFERIVPYFYKQDPSQYRWGGSHTDVAVLQEAISRGMLKKAIPSTTVVFSQPKPAALVGV
jgi:hypothetical protein